MEKSHLAGPTNSRSDLRLRIIGNGAAVNHKLPHNSALLNNQLLMDCPPDIVHSLQTLNINSSQIDTLYISHFHGDHTFGFPFFVLDKWIQKGDRPTKLTVFGPRKVQEYLFKLTEMAWAKEHPCYQWLLMNSEFHEVKKGTNVPYQEYQMSIFKMEHIKNTFGFTLIDKTGMPRFSYMTDTRWGPSIAKELRRKPRTVLIDINGGYSGMHMSYNEVIEHCIKITGQETHYLGTHIGQPMTSSHEMIQVINQGEEYDL